ncbi:MAG TPA: xylulokinase [Clostridiales bacterium]|jgi:xylulokinase|nr:xylulokinase [Clostridiales bacterium]
MGYLLGIDLGTSSVRATLVAPEGDVVEIAARQYPISIPRSDWAEQDPELWWQSTCEAIKEVMHKSGTAPKGIRALGLSGQMHGLTLLDEAGKPIRPAVIWADKRSQEECREIRGLVDEKRLYSITGMPIATGFFGVSLFWMKRHEPTAYDNVRIALLPKDYIRYRLTGEFATDATDGSGTLIFDVRKRNWSQEIITSLGLRDDLLPEVLESSEIAGVVSKVAAEETGLAPGTLVAAGGGDQAMGAIGAGIMDQGIVGSVLGTGGQMITSIQEPVFDPKQRIHTMCHAKEDAWLLMGAILAGGLSLRWFKENLGGVESLAGDMCGISPYELLSMESEKVEPGCNGLVFLPYLAGERTPHMNPKARGCFVGLTLSHTKAHMARAVMEGVTFAMKDCLCIFQDLGVPIKSIVCSGGGAKSPVWRQIQADVYGTRLAMLSNDEHSSYGAALIAGVASGVYEDVLELRNKQVSNEHIIHPIEKNRPVYEKQYSVFRSLYPALEGAFEMLG